jgi:hypothetical protein
MVGILPLLASDSVRRSFIGVVFSVFSLVYYRETEPFLVTSTNALAGFLVLFFVHILG